MSSVLEIELYTSYCLSQSIVIQWRIQSARHTAIAEDNEDDPLRWQRHHLFCDSLTHRLIGIRQTYPGLEPDTAAKPDLIPMASYLFPFQFYTRHRSDFKIADTFTRAFLFFSRMRRIFSACSSDTESNHVDPHI